MKCSNLRDSWLRKWTLFTPRSLKHQGVVLGQERAAKCLEKILSVWTRNAFEQTVVYHHASIGLRKFENRQRGALEERSLLRTIESFAVNFKMKLACDFLNEGGKLGSGVTRIKTEFMWNTVLFTKLEQIKTKSGFEIVFTFGRSRVFTKVKSIEKFGVLHLVE